jgi:hypothetical protein
MGRATQGVRVMNLATDEKLVSIARLAEEDVADAPVSPAEAGSVEAPAADAAPSETPADETDGGE